MIAADRDRDSLRLRFDLPVRRSTRMVSFDTTHVAKGCGLWLWAERHRCSVALLGSARRGWLGGSTRQLGAARWLGRSARRLRSKKIKQILLRKKIICIRKKKNSFAKIEKEIPRKYFFSKLELNGN